jgi:hypothetical protein
MNDFWRILVSLGGGLMQTQGQAGPQNQLISGNYGNGAFESQTFVNSVVGWNWFFDRGILGGSTVIGNVEAGLVWGGHEAFVRPPGAATGVSTYQNTAVGARNELDFHATMVGHVLVGSGYIPTNGGAYTLAGLGMAPEAALVSGGIAVDFSPTDLGAFSITPQSVVNVYQAMFQGVGVARADVINSSWGGGDPSSSGVESLALDGLARQNASVAHVVSAGNGGNARVGAPASGFNNIAVGSLGGASFLQPSVFSSQGAVDFFNPVTNVTLTGVRSAVDIAAPGERMVLAAYLGDAGSLGASTIPNLTALVQPVPPPDPYFLNMDGTSFSAPIVAGGIALLKDGANFVHPPGSNAQDTRVIKSVIMAGSRETAGWDNGQNEMNVTTRALDRQTGAGALDLVAAAEVYFFGTADVPGSTGGVIANQGWDSAVIGLESAFEYRFASEFTQEMSLTVALNWFSVREFDDQSGTGADLAFSNLDLQVWSLDSEGRFLAKVGESMTTYENSEFLRIGSLAAGNYGLRVVFGSMVFDTTAAVSQETYGLAWNASAIPEPSALLMGCGSLLVGLRRCRAKPSS